MKLFYQSFIRSIRRTFRTKGFTSNIQIVILLITVILNLLLIRANNKTAKANEKSTEISDNLKRSESYRATREMCYDFNVRYWMYDETEREKHSKDLDFLHLWTYPTWKWEINDSISNEWKIMKMKDSVSKDNLFIMKSLSYNIELSRLLNYFEDAKMMDGSGYLDKEYFYNFFITAVRRFIQINEANVPTFSDYIDYKRGLGYNLKEHADTVKNVNLFDGFDYCLINIFIPLSDKEGDTSTYRLLNNYWNDKLKKYENFRKVKVEKDK